MAKIFFSVFNNNMELKNHYCDYTFQARPGKRLTKLVRKEYSGDKTRVDKFKSLFDRVHNKLDTNTVVDIDKKERYIFSNTSFPNISYCYEQKLAQGPLSEVVVTECPKTFVYGQLLLFRNIVKILSERNIPLEEIEKMGVERVTHPYARKIFIEAVKIAKWIRENQPKQNLNQINFAIADNLMATEILSENREVLAKLENDLPNYIAKIRELLEQ